MRLSDWPARAPVKDIMSPKVIAVAVPILTAMGAEADPVCWVAWGDDPAVRYMILAPTSAGLLEIHVRVNVPQEGPRASGKLVRWSRVQTGELAIEMTGGHRLLTFQVEGQVLRGSDVEADEVASFALDLFAAIDGRGTAFGSTAAAGHGSADAASGPASRPPDVVVASAPGEAPSASSAEPREVRRLPPPRDG